ncbi:recombinase family protein [Mesorhizobium ventifaucium]|uniref:Resolvase n=1 Tax=Mesorhizobium ventifaucium TaxID=666020 RepID=A0ABN8JB77_9HYPH|nr:recombinase family protein [Mesorhizobium ventifaucium]CAH2394523.1 Resolvase [Mesorhizobium ventifaucium]
MTTVSRPRAYSYVRFSSPEQAKGDSYRRQTEKAAAYAAKHGLILDDKLNMFDEGISAFMGKNVTMGALGNFLSLVQHGDIPKGSFLLAENIDRISRDVVTEAMATLTMLINSGITLVTLTDERAYSRESINKQPFAIMEIIMGFIRANDESARKQQLIRDSWIGKRRKMVETGKIMTARCPGWLRLREDRLAFDLIHERAKVVQRMFEMTLAGAGQHAIAAMFNREGIPVFRGGKHWIAAYVAKVLRSPATIGRFQPMRHEGLVRVAAGEPIEDYYPAVVDRETFEQVQEIKGRGAGAAVVPPKGSTTANLLAGLAVCPMCDGTMTRVNKGGATATRRRTYLVCVNAKRGAGCGYKSVPLHDIEDAIAEKAVEFAIGVPSPDAGLEIEWQRLQNDDEAHQDEIGRIMDAIKAVGHSAALLDTLRELEADRAEINKRLIVMGERVTASLTNRVQQTVERLIEGLEAPVRDVPAINATMRRLFDRVTVNWPQGDLEFHWRHAPGEVSRMNYAWPKEAA